MTNVHYRGSWLVYFNGIEVPADSVQVNGGVGQIPECRVSMPPSPLLRGIGREDRVRCTVFYLDLHAYETPTFCLLFDGEIVEQQTATSADARSMTFVAVDMIAILTQFFPYFVQSTSTLVESEVGTANNQVSTTAAPFPRTTVLFNTQLANPGQAVKRPFDVLINVIELCLGTGAAENDRSVVATQFFKRWEARTKLRQRCAASDNASDINTTGVFPILRMAQDESVLDAVTSIGDRVATGGSYYAMLQSIFQHVYYDIHMGLAPCFVGTDSVTRESSGPHVEGQTLPSLVQYITKPRIYYGIAPRFNVVWPSMTTSHNYSENFASQPTRTYLGNPHIFKVIAPNSRPSVFVQRAMTVAFPQEAQDMLSRRKESAAVNQDNYLVYPEEYYKGPVYQNLDTPSWFAYMAAAREGDRAPRAQVLYAAMEHYRTRGSFRNGSITTTFNPYVSHGFPLVVLDKSDNKTHIMADALAVSHTLTQNSMTTSVNYSYAQDFNEFMEQFVAMRALYAQELGEVSYAPFHPIRELRERFQIDANAKSYYRRLFYQSAETAEATFSYDEEIGLELDGTVGPLEYGARAVPNYTTGYVPRFVAKRESLGHQDAMKYAARPVCTLEQFITFCGEKGARDGLVAATDQIQGKGASYYVRILGLTPGPGQRPGTKTDGSQCSVLDADTRVNWEPRLLAYRQQVYFKKNHSPG